MNLAPNEGTRPSKLALAQRAVGERAEALPDDVAKALATAATRVLPFDAAALRARAGGVGVAAPSTSRAANNGRWFSGFALAAVALLVVIGLTRTPEPTIGVRGGQQLALYQLDGGRLAPWDGGALGAGDVLGVRVRPGEAEGVVVLSVDGTGTATVFWPAEGDRPEPVEPGDWTELPGTITLDGAPGPEVFVVVFDRSADRAASEAADAWKGEGSEGVLAWGDEVGDAIRVERR